MTRDHRRTATIIAHDPGSQNYGVAVVKVQIQEGLDSDQLLDGLSFSVLYAGRLKSNFTTLKDRRLAERELVSYKKEIQLLYDEFQPDFQVAERFMSRRMGGVTIELVNMLLGALRAYAHEQQVPLYLIPASQWKNELKRREVDLKQMYKDAKKEKRTAHELDAVFIGLYGAFKKMGVRPYNVSDPNGLARAVMHKIGGRN